MNKISQKEFDIIKSNAELIYRGFGEIYCPYFQEKIIFNSKGFEHVRFKRRNHARNLQDQYIRFKILKFAPEVIRLSKTVQGVLEQNIFENMRSDHKNELTLVDAVFYEFIAILEKVRVRVIVKQINSGQKYFWSIIPFWKKDISHNKRIFHYGSPEED